jgi:hypothetical protein
MPDDVTLSKLIVAGDKNKADSVSFGGNLTLTNGGSFTDANENANMVGNTYLAFTSPNKSMTVTGGTFAWTAGNITSGTQSTLIPLNINSSATLNCNGALNTGQLLGVNLNIGNSGTWQLNNTSNFVLSSFPPSITINSGGTMSITANNSNGITRSTITDPWTAIDDKGVIMVNEPSPINSYGIDACVHVDGGTLSPTVVFNMIALATSSGEGERCQDDRRRRR